MASEPLRILLFDNSYRTEGEKKYEDHKYR